jgi:hypothetical protein
MRTPPRRCRAREGRPSSLVLALLALARLALARLVLARLVLARLALARLVLARLVRRSGLLAGPLPSRR